MLSQVISKLVIRVELSRANEKRMRISSNDGSIQSTTSIAIIAIDFVLFIMFTL